MQINVQHYTLSEHQILPVTKIIEMSVVNICWNEISLFKYEGKR